MRLLGSGVNLHGTPTRLGPAPIVGEDTDSVLAELGFPEGYLSDTPPATQPSAAATTVN